MSDALARTLEARSVALVGASARPGSLGRRMVTEAMRSPGLERVHLVNPSYAEVAGLPCVPDLNALDDAPDLVLLGVGDARLVDQLTAAAKVGARGAVVFGSAHADGVRDELRRVGDRRRDGPGGRRVHGLLERTPRRPRHGLHRARRPPRRPRLAGHPLGLGLLHVAAHPAAPRVRPGRVVRTGAGHDHRRLRRPPRRAQARPGCWPWCSRPSAAATGSAGRCAGLARPAWRWCCSRSATRPSARRWWPRTPARWPADRGRGRRSPTTSPATWSPTWPSSATPWPCSPRPGDPDRARASRPSTTPAPSAAWSPTSRTASTCASPSWARPPSRPWPTASTRAWWPRTPWTSGVAAPTPSGSSPTAWPRWPPTRRSA